MTSDAKRKRERIAVFVFFVCVILGSYITINGYLGRVAVDPLQVYQVAHPLSVHQGEQFNMSVSIKNPGIDYKKDILDVNLFAQIPSEVEFLSSTIPDMVPENDSRYDAEIIRYNFGSISPQGFERFTVTYNVTSDNTATMMLSRVNVSYRLEEWGEESSFILAEPANSIEILLKGKAGVTQEPTLLPPPSGTIVADPIFPVIGYTLPILAFGMSGFVMRRLFRRKRNLLSERQ